MLFRSAPVRKGARVIREIAWRLREIGADGRICDLIDSQVAAIEDAAGRLSPADLANALSGAFDRIEGKIATFDEDATPSAPPEADASTPDLGSAPEAETAAISEAVADEPVMTAVSETASEPTDTFDAGDEAMLDMIAMEMAAPDTDEAYEPSIEELEALVAEAEGALAGKTPVHPPQAAKIQQNTGSWEIDVSFESDAAKSDANKAAAEPAKAAALPAVTPLQPAPEPVAEAEPAPSLGSSLIANGIVSRPRSKPDPLAPIRRMSQNEKIAFFS